MSAQARNTVAVANRLLLKKLFVVSALMFGFGFALVPFYEKICQVTGVRDVFTEDAAPAKNTQVDTTRSVNVEFDANIQRLAWTFKPLEPYVAVHPGEVTRGCLRDPQYARPTGHRAGGSELWAGAGIAVLQEA